MYVFIKGFHIVSNFLLFLRETNCLEGATVSSFMEPTIGRRFSVREEMVHIVNEHSSHIPEKT